MPKSPKYECVDVYEPETNTMQSVIRPVEPPPRKPAKKRAAKKASKKAPKSARAPKGLMDRFNF